jgi:hypothetical protein
MVVTPDHSQIYMGLLILDATGVRVVELEAAKVGDLDEQRKKVPGVPVRARAPMGWP